MNTEYYLQLLQSFPPKLIKTEEEYQKVEEVIENLVQKGNLIEEELEYIDLLITLVFVYEKDAEIYDVENRGFKLKDTCEKLYSYYGSLISSE